MNDEKSHNTFELSDDFFNFRDKVSVFNNFNFEEGDIMSSSKTSIPYSGNGFVHFDANFENGFDTYRTWNCAFEGAFIPEGGNASASNGNNSIGIADQNNNKLPITIDADTAGDTAVIILESKNYLKLSNATRTLAFIKGNFVAPESTSVDILFLIRGGIAGSIAAFQADWNIDSFISNDPASKNPSGIELDFTKTQTLVLDYNNKAIGDVKMGFLVGTTIYYAHEIAQNQDTNLFPFTPAFGTMNLPLRVSANVTTNRVGIEAGIFNDQKGVAFCAFAQQPIGGYVANFSLSSSTVYSIGSPNRELVKSFPAGTEGTLPRITTEAPICSIKCKSSLYGEINRTVFSIKSLSCIASDADLNQSVLIKILYNATLSAGTTTFSSVADDSGVEFNTGATATTGGIEIFRGYVAINEEKQFDFGEIFEDFNKQYSRSDITFRDVVNLSEDQQLTVVALSTGVGANVGATFNIVEKV